MNRFGRSKYVSKKIKLDDGSVFDSKLEYHRFLVLRDMESKGLIQDLRRQVSFELIPGQYVEESKTSKTGKVKIVRKCVERPCSYLADFVYLHNGREIVEDSKGMRTKEYVIKRKLMRLQGHPIFETHSPNQPIITD